LVDSVGSMMMHKLANPKFKRERERGFYSETQLRIKVLT